MHISWPKCEQQLLFTTILFVKTIPVYCLVKEFKTGIRRLGSVVSVADSASKRTSFLVKNYIWSLSPWTDLQMCHNSE